MIIGSSLAWRRTMDIVMQAAPSEATVLLLGESGTGKELLARALHDNSARATRAPGGAAGEGARSGGPFVAVNCAAIPESILEAELFGYEKGAFTGATTARDGRFEAAHGGTLFLDEIGEISRHVQVKLLRVLQEGEIERLGGGGKPRSIDVRIVAATNVNLAEEVKAGRFREDLYYRLNVIPVNVPPLRDRRDDIPLLAQHFVQVYAEKNGKAIAGCSAAAIERLVEYGWPGNVRELENAIERAVALTTEPARTEQSMKKYVSRGSEIADPGHGIGDLADVPDRDAACRDRDADDPRDAAPHARRQAADREAARDRDPHDLSPARSRRADGRTRPGRGGDITG